MGESPIFGYARPPEATTETHVLQVVLMTGDDRNRTGVHGFAGRCVTTPPRRRGLKRIGHPSVEGLRRAGGPTAERSAVAGRVLAA